MVADILLRGLYGNSPSILERSDEAFLPAAVDELQSEAGRVKNKATLANERQGTTLKLFQPIQRIFHLVMLEAVCDWEYAFPRLEPARIASAGMVIRRYEVVNGKRTGRLEGWVSGDNELRGWVRLADERADPDPARRPLSLRSGNTEIDRLLSLHIDAATPLAEATTPLFVAPPPICQATSKTILYGNVSLTSNESGQLPPALPAYDIDSMRDKFTPDAIASSKAFGRIFLKSIKPELPAATRSEIDKLLDSGNPLTDKSRNQALNNVFLALQQRTAQMMSGRRRYDDQNQLYQLRAFLRVQRDDNCPPELVWSVPSEPFVIATWYEAAAHAPPPVQIPLPNPFNLQKMKPNVSFLVPEGLFNFLQSNDLDSLFAGDKPNSSAGLALDWICSFNIPIITLCAFIMLSIFLSLLNIVFSWLAFVKICLPIPKS